MPPSLTIVLNSFAEATLPFTFLSHFWRRPEMKFSGLDELLGRINTDIGIARTQLDLPQWQGFREDPFLQR